MFFEIDPTRFETRSELGVVGINHKSSVLEDREYLSNSVTIYDKVRSTGLEHAVVTTCNRTEIIYTSPQDQFKTATDFIAHTVFDEKNKKFNFYKYRDADAITHFYRVAAGLDSMVLGEAEILGQLKKAYTTAVEFGSVRTMLHKLFQSAFRTAKEIRTSTGIGRGKISVASTAVEAAYSVFGDLTNLSVLLIGAGETSHLLANHLLKRGVNKFYISNRTEQNAKKITTLTKGIFIPLEKIEMIIPHVDIVAVAITQNDSGPLITEKQFKEVTAKQQRKIYCFLDLSVPRAIDTNISQMSSAYVFNIDSIETISKHNLDQRTTEAIRAEEIIQTHVDAFLNWQNNRVIHEHVKTLFAYYRDISRSELEKIMEESSSKNSPKDKVEKTVNAMAKKFYAPILSAIKSGNMSDKELKLLLKQITDIE